MNRELIDKFFESMTQQELEKAFDKYKKYSEDNRKGVLMEKFPADKRPPNGGTYYSDIGPVFYNKIYDRWEDDYLAADANPTWWINEVESNDKVVLQFIHDRLIHVYGENENVDFVNKLRQIIKKY